MMEKATIEPTNNERQPTPPRATTNKKKCETPKNALGRIRAENVQSSTIQAKTPYTAPQLRLKVILI
jgi:hypothetical protein